MFKTCRFSLNYIHYFIIYLFLFNFWLIFYFIHGLFKFTIFHIRSISIFLLQFNLSYLFFYCFLFSLHFLNPYCPSMLFINLFLNSFSYFLIFSRVLTQISRIFWRRFINFKHRFSEHLFFFFSCCIIFIIFKLFILFISF